MTPLDAILRRQIAQTGPLTVADYMTLCLAHPTHGYYRKQDPLGARGDFTTAPEISQMFGEMIGLWIAQVWVDAGRPSPFRLVELGPGRGTLMADAVRAAAAAPGFREAADLWLVETSPVLRAAQSAALPAATPQFAETFSEIPLGAPLFLIANEFFDALPIRQIQRKGGVWRERVIGLDGDRLTWGLGGSIPHEEAPEGALREFCPLSTAIMAEVAARIATDGGAALIVDYGYGETPPMGGDTFQALRRHGFADPLADPGEADLTAHVDFAALAEAATAAAGPAVRVAPLTTQGVFLERLGIALRAQALAKTAEGDANRVNPVESALRRLTHPNAMGRLFKVLAISNTEMPVLPGLETSYDDRDRDGG
jgi:SAM-dependent MidA family methyltransferase